MFSGNSLKTNSTQLSARHISSESLYCFIFMHFFDLLLHNYPSLLNDSGLFC